MSDLDKIRKALESLYDQFGPDAVNTIITNQQPRRERFKSERGAPTIDRIDRDALVYVLVEAVRLATNQNIKWCCSWLEGKVTIRGRETRGGRMWSRTWENSGSFRRQFYAARTCFRSGDQQGGKAFSAALQALIVWRHNNVNPRWGFMMTTHSGLPLDFNPADRGPRAEIDTLFRGIDDIVDLFREKRTGQLEELSHGTPEEIKSFLKQIVPFADSPIDLLQEMKRQLEQRSFERCAENTAH